LQRSKTRPTKRRKEVEIPKLSLIHSKKLQTLVPTAIVGIIMIALSLSYPPLAEDASIQTTVIVFGALFAIVPITLMHLKEVQRKDNIDKNLPLFLLALSSAVQSGANLVRAIETAADRNMGPLTPELKNLRANISWGMPIEDAFENFAERTGTKMSRRVSTLLEMSLKIGGDIRANLEMIQQHVTDLQNLEKDRKTSLAPYTYTIYISFAVFLGISVILSSQFFSEFLVIQKMLIDSPGITDGGMFSSIINMDIEALNSILFNMSLIEAVFGGLAAGKIGSGNYVSGMKHIIVMIVMAVAAFALI